MVDAHADLKLLAAILVFLWPLRVIFPFQCKQASQHTIQEVVYFMTSLSLTIRLISWTIMELTDTDVYISIMYSKIGVEE